MLKGRRDPHFKYRRQKKSWVHNKLHPWKSVSLFCFPSSPRLHYARLRQRKTGSYTRFFSIFCTVLNLRSDTEKSGMLWLELFLVFSEDTGFKIRSVDRLPLLRFFVIFLNSYNRFLEWYINVTISYLLFSHFRWYSHQKYIYIYIYLVTQQPNGKSQRQRKYQETTNNINTKQYKSKNYEFKNIIYCSNWCTQL